MITNRPLVVTNPKLADPHKARREGYGTKLQKVIHRVVDQLPISEETKQKIKECPGCGKRVERIDSWTE